MGDPISIEICVDSLASAVAAEQGGAQRVELCADLSRGGVTPSAGLIESVRAMISIGLHIMIRPRGGDFCYTDEEFDAMRRDILFAKQLSADGVVLGILTPAGEIDVDHTRELVELARPLNVTFHRAFDVSADLSRALEDICKTGANRILTSGGARTACEGVSTLAALVQAAKGRISIMACGGIRANNAPRIIEQTGVREIHSGLSRPVPNAASRNTKTGISATFSGPHERFQVFPEDVRDLCCAVS
jgi:copper homeostasis protein